MCFFRGSIEAKDAKGRTALRLATYGDYLETATELAQLGANLYGQNNYRRSPLSTPCRAGHNHIIDLLIANSADVNFKDEVDQNPLFEVVAVGKLEAIRRILGAHAIDVNSEDNDKKRAVQLAAERRNYVVVKLLVSRGAVVDRQRQEFIDQEENIRQGKEDLD